MARLISELNELRHVADSVLVYGHFTTIHPGHIRYLIHAKSIGKQLYIALVGDDLLIDKVAYPFSQSDRANSLLCLDIVDVVVCLKGTELANVIDLLRPQAVVLGTDLEGSSLLKDAFNIAANYSIPVLFHSGNTALANYTEIFDLPEREIKAKRIQEFNKACERQGLSKMDLIESIKSWSQCKLIVVGDTIIDQFSACEPLGLSAEAPVVVVRELGVKNFLGAAAIVACHIKSLGADVEFVSVVGNDENAILARDELDRMGIQHHLITDDTRPTTLKKRYIVENQKLFRVSRLEQSRVGSKSEEVIISKLRALAPNANGIVVSDFVYGVITDRVLNEIHSLSERYQLMLFGDIQCSTQVGSILKFQNFSLISPNEKEIRYALQDKDSGLEELAHKLIRFTSCKHLILKLAGDGLIAYEYRDQTHFISQSFPALSVNPVDVSGAGDSVLSVMSIGLASKQSMMTSSALACCVSSLCVESMGNSPVQKEALTQYIHRIMP